MEALVALVIPLSLPLVEALKATKNLSKWKHGNVVCDILCMVSKSKFSNAAHTHSNV